MAAAPRRPKESSMGTLESSPRDVIMTQSPGASKRDFKVSQKSSLGGTPRPKDPCMGTLESSPGELYHITILWAPKTVQTVNEINPSAARRRQMEPCIRILESSPGGSIIIGTFFVVTRLCRRCRGTKPSEFFLKKESFFWAPIWATGIVLQGHL